MLVLFLIDNWFKLDGCLLQLWVKHTAMISGEAL